MTVLAVVLGDGEVAGTTGEHRLGVMGCRAQVAVLDDGSSVGLQDSLAGEALGCHPGGSGPRGLGLEFICMTREVLLLDCELGSIKKQHF